MLAQSAHEIVQTENKGIEFGVGAFGCAIAWSTGKQDCKAQSKARGRVNYIQLVFQESAMAAQSLTKPENFHGCT